VQPDHDPLKLVQDTEPVELVPNGDRVLVGDIGQIHDKTLNSGLILPAYEQQRKGLRKGLVIAVGERVRNIEPEMTVYFIETVAFEIDGKVVIGEPDILVYEKPR
jgi:co-chaperonin GroES (HSP10)